MAVTKIKPIRGTVNKALAYILDPQKTDDAFYVSSYGCAASDAAAKEFEWTRNLAVQQGINYTIFDHSKCEAISSDLYYVANRNMELKKRDCDGLFRPLSAGRGEDD